MYFNINIQNYYVLKKYENLGGGIEYVKRNDVKASGIWALQNDPQSKGSEGTEANALMRQSVVGTVIRQSVEG